MAILPDRINASRGRVQWIIRGAAVILLAFGLYLCLKRIAFGIGVGQLSMAVTTWNDIGETHSFYRGLAMILVGAGLAFSSRPLARWIIAMPPEGCPRCGHARAPGEAGAPGAPAPRCPECGLELVSKG